MSRLDDIEARLAALEQGGDLSQRVKALEDMLGASPAPVGKTMHCGRCGSDKVMDDSFRCPQEKCPLK